MYDPEIENGWHGSIFDSIRRPLIAIAGAPSLGLEIQGLDLQDQNLERERVTISSFSENVSVGSTKFREQFWKLTAKRRLDLEVPTVALFGQEDKL
jgi:hypothetical protein